MSSSLSHILIASWQCMRITMYFMCSRIKIYLGDIRHKAYLNLCSQSSSTDEAKTNNNKTFEKQNQYCGQHVCPSGFFFTLISTCFLWHILRARFENFGSCVRPFLISNRSPPFCIKSTMNGRCDETFVANQIQNVLFETNQCDAV